MRAILAGFAIAILAGCYQSEAPLLTADTGQCPFRDVTHFNMGVVTVASDDGSRTRIEVEPTENGECVARSPGGDVRLTFVEMSGKGWLVQATPDEALRTEFELSDPVLYALAREERGVWMFMPPPCGEDWLSDLEKRFRISVRNQSRLDVCAASDADSLTTMMTILAQTQFLPLVIFEPA